MSNHMRSVREGAMKGANLWDGLPAGCFYALVTCVCETALHTNPSD